MVLRIGQVLRGAKGAYELLQPLKTATVFKARVLSSASSQPEWAVVKTAMTEPEKMCLRREHRNHNIPEIAASPFIRQMRDAIRIDNSQDEPSCLVFEWMDRDLHSVPVSQFRENAYLPKVVSRSILSALQTFNTLNAIHTDVSPNNIYISNVERDSPIVRLGDLGNAVRDGSVTQRCQSLPCRAPEVWQGYSCRHESDIWSLAVTLTTKLSYIGLFGHLDKTTDDRKEAWCIAKIMRIVGPLGPPVSNHTYQEEFKVAEQLAVMDDPSGLMKLIDRKHWREELEDLPDPPVSVDLLNFIEMMLVIDPNKRPSAAEVLQHRYLRSIK